MSLHTIERGTIRLSTVGILTPPNFPVSSYESIHKRVIERNQKVPIPEDVLREFQAGWNAVVYRFCATVDHDAAFTQSIKANGVSPPMDARYIQERELFGFFVTGLSVFESLSYSCYAVGAMVKREEFPLQSEKDRLNVKPKTTAVLYSSHFRTDELSSAWQSLISSVEFNELKRIRNVLAHRASPPRHITDAATVNFQTGEVSDQTWQAEWKQFGISIDLETTSSRQVWLANAVGELIAAADRFTELHL